MQRPHFLTALAGSALAAGALRGAASAAAPRPKLLPGQRLVAFAVTDMATVIDFAGPWEVFQDVPLPGHDGESAFLLGMVGDDTSTVQATAGMQLVPRYTFANAPRPDVVVVGAQKGSPALTAWLKDQAASAEVIMSVCTGAFRVAQAGLFDGKSATTHHDFYDAFEKRFPNVKLVRGPRFVDQGKVCSAGGLTSGIDLALHVVERLHGAHTANQVASYMEFVRTARPAGEARG
jgi:transcriptional regulator GlxA family with amidase domain